MRRWAMSRSRPQVFDRAEKNFEAGYDQPSMEKGRAARGKISTEALLLDTQAAIDAVKSAGKVGIVGYCMGGSVAFLAATRLNGLSAAVGYYGGQIAPVAEEKPRIPDHAAFRRSGSVDPADRRREDQEGAARPADLRLQGGPRLPLRRARVLQSPSPRRSPAAGPRNSSRRTSARPGLFARAGGRLSPAAPGKSDEQPLARGGATSRAR